MRVAIISTYRTVVPHFETELDIAQQHLDAGDEVLFLNCTGGLENCEFNVSKSAEVCRQCVGRRQMGLHALDGTTTCLEMTAEGDLPGRPVDRFESVEQLIDYRIGDFDIGYAALSSLVSYCRDPEPDLERHREVLNQFLRSAWQAYQQTLTLLEMRQIDRVYAYNGRFAAMRGILRACQQLGVDCQLHERGCDAEHYELFPNHLPHDLEKIESAIRLRWHQGQVDPQRDVIARSWFEERVARVEKVWHSFTKEQQAGKLPEAWNHDARNLSIFCSSDDEFVAIGDAWRNELYPNQVTAIEKIARDLWQLQPETRITLRMHPNLRGVDNDRTRAMRALTVPNLNIVAPESSIDTYEVVRQSDVVVTFGSSVGMESVFWGTPSVLLGPCFYQNLGGVYRATSHQQYLQILMSELEPQPITGALMYGYWFQTRGFPHRYFQASGLFEGTFKGKTLYAQPAPKPPRLQRWKRRIRRWLAAEQADAR